MKAALRGLILGSLFGLVVWLLLILPQSRWLENLWLDACFVTRGVPGESGQARGFDQS
jgi:hypothetical protein